MNFDTLMYLFSAKRIRFIIFPITTSKALWRDVVVCAPYLIELSKKELRIAMWKAKRSNIYVTIDEILHRPLKD